MKTYLKKAFCLTLCAVLLCAAIPVSALAGNDSFDVIDTSVGVRAEGSAVVNTIHSVGSMDLSFVSGVNHLPQEDYNCHVDIGVTIPGTGRVWFYADPVNQMCCSTVAPPFNNESKVEFKYWVLSTQVGYLKIPKN